MNREINIRLNANRAKAVHTGHKFASGDKGIVFRIAVDELDTTGTTAKIVFKRSNGTSVEAGITGTEGVYSYTTLGNEFAVVGPVTADVKFYENENRVSTSTFVYDVTADTLDGLGNGTAGYSDTLERMKKSMEQAEADILAAKDELESRAEEILQQMKETAENAEEDVETAEKKMVDLSADLEALYQEYVDAFGSTGPFNPRGPYSETETYTVRDMVTHNDASWVCYRNCTGATPSKESDCWQYLAVGSEVNLDDIASLEDLKEVNGTGESLTTSILEKAKEVGVGVHVYRLSGASYTGTDLPSAAYAYSMARIEKKGTNDIVVTLPGVLNTNGKLSPPIFNVWSGVIWSGWNIFATTANLANHIPNFYTGTTTEELDTIFNDLHANALPESVYEAIVKVSFSGYVLGGGTYYLRGYRSTSGDYGWQKAIIYGDGTPPREYKRSMYGGTWEVWHLEDYLQSTGGTVSNGGMHPFSIKGASTTSLLRYFNSASELLGYLGFINNKPVFQSNENRANEILHTGNKPTGTYTGNGSATERTVNIGGVGETLRIVNSALGIAFVTNDGAHCITKDGVLIIPPSECKFTNGTLTMATTSSVVNANGYGFSYDLL